MTRERLGLHLDWSNEMYTITYLHMFSVESELRKIHNITL